METFNKKFVIAIDGPSASGKSTIARATAKELNITYIDTGSMFRAFAYFFYLNNIEITEENIKRNIDDIDILLTNINNNITVFLNGDDVTKEIRQNEISILSSQISKYSLVREKLVGLQRKMSKEKSVVLEGRDIGTVVFPNADLKIFLVCSSKVRATRRKEELKIQGVEISVEEVEKELLERDKLDSTREISPLTKAVDAIEIDTSNNKSPYDSVEKIVELLKEKIKEK